MPRRSEGAARVWRDNRRRPPGPGECAEPGQPWIIHRSARWSGSRRLWRPQSALNVSRALAGVPRIARESPVLQATLGITAINCLLVRRRRPALGGSRPATPGSGPALRPSHRHDGANRVGAPWMRLGGAPRTLPSFPLRAPAPLLGHSIQPLRHGRVIAPPCPAARTAPTGLLSASTRG
jgi:hypothetical protein